MSDQISPAKLAEYHVLDTPPEDSFDDFTRLAAQLCGSPISLITILDSARQWFKSRLGIEVSETPIEHSFCAQAIRGTGIMEVHDAARDPRFAKNPLVGDTPNIRFYAGIPLITEDGFGIGSLCVIDTKPRTLTPVQRDCLEILGRQLMHLFELRRVGRLLKESEERERIHREDFEGQVERRTRRMVETEQKFRQFVENTTDVFWLTEAPSGRVLYVSPAVTNLWGLPAERFYAEPGLWRQLVDSDDLPRVLEWLKNAYESDIRSLAIEYRIICPDQSRKWIHYRGTVMVDDKTGERRIAGYTKEITERKEAEDRLRMTAQRLQLAAKASRVGIWDFNLTTGELDWDEQMYVLYGLIRDQAKPGYERWLDRLHPDDRSKAMARVESSIAEDGLPLDTEFRIIRESDGEVRVIRAIATIFDRGHARERRLIGTNWDVTDDRSREQALRQALAQEKELTRAAQAGERAKEEFLAAMSHEIRTPLNGMLGFADMLAEVPEMPPEAESYLQTISESGQALLRIINDILDFSGGESGRLQIDRIDFDPTSLVDDIFSFFHPDAHLKGLSIRKLIDPQIPERVVGDPGRIRQILINLVGNSLKFTEEGVVEIELKIMGPSRGDTLCFCVSDSGPGIPDEQLDSIFKPFFQLDSSNRRRFGGTGLGLSISRKLAVLMGGFLRVENLPLGCRFILGLPLQIGSLQAQDPIEVTFSYPEARITKVLVAEDDRINARLILKMLSSLGYDAVCVDNGRKAVAAFAADRPECIIMDIQMPEMDGIEAAQAIRTLENNSKQPPVFIAALTADVMPENQQRSKNAGMNAYLNKPIKKKEIEEMLRQAAMFKLHI